MTKQAAEVLKGRRKVPNSSEPAEESAVAPHRFAFGPFVLDMHRASLIREGRPVAAGHRGLLLLDALLRAPSQVLSKTALMEAVWSDAIVEESNLSVQIAALRKLLGPQPDGSEWIVFRITDTGIGLSSEQLDRAILKRTRGEIAVLDIQQ